MGIEAATYISQLVSSNPLGTDKKFQGDDHVRLLKSVLLNTFPNASRAYTFGEWAEKKAGFISNVADRIQAVDDNGQLIYFDCSTGPKVYNLLPAATALTGFTCFVDRDFTVANALTIDPSGGELINDAATVSIQAGESGLLYKTASGWRFFYTKSSRVNIVGLVVRLAAEGTAVTIESLAAAALGPGPIVELYRNPSDAVTAGNVLGRVDFLGDDDAAGKRRYAFIDALIRDPATASLDGILRLATLVAGVEVDTLRLADGVVVGDPTGSFPGAGKLNAAADLQINGVTVKNKVVGRYYNEYVLNADLSVIIPLDDTVPLITEGTEVLKIDVTTTSATQIVDLDVVAFGRNGNQATILALFRGSTCIGTAVCTTDGGTEAPLKIEVADQPGPAGVYSYTVRAGGSGGTIRLNGTTSGRYFGGTLKSTLRGYVIEP